MLNFDILNIQSIKSMNFFNIYIQNYFEDVSDIQLIFRQSIKLKIIKEEHLPTVPSKDERPLPSPLIEDINSGKLANRISSYSITTNSKKRCDSIYSISDREKFIEVSCKNIDKKGVYTFCRAAKIQFSDEVHNYLKEFGKVYLFAIFDSFDLKVGTDLRIKSIVLTPLEMEQITKEQQQIKHWNESIFNVKNTYTRLKYRISEIECV